MPAASAPPQATREAGDVAQVVAGVGQQRERVDLPAVERLDRDEQQVEHDADRERAVEVSGFDRTVRMRVAVVHRRVAGGLVRMTAALGRFRAVPMSVVIARMSVVMGIAVARPVTVHVPLLVTVLALLPVLMRRIALMRMTMRSRRAPVGNDAGDRSADGIARNSHRRAGARRTSGRQISGPTPPPGACASRRSPTGSRAGRRSRCRRRRCRRRHRRPRGCCRS